jgi:hypothetical protein
VKRPDRKFIIATALLVAAGAAVGSRPAPARIDAPAEHEHGERVMPILEKLIGQGGS